MAKQIHQKFMDANVGDTLTISASEKSAAVLYAGEIRRIDSDTRFTWSDTEIEDDVTFVLTKAGSYFVEVLVTFVKQPKTTTVTVEIEGGESKVVKCDSGDGLIHMITVAISVFES